MPARTAEQEAFFAGQDETFTQKPDWQVAVDSIQFADNPNFESYMPAYNETLGLVGSGGKYTTRWQTEQNLDMAKEFEALQRRDPGHLGQVALTGRTRPDRDPARSARAGSAQREEPMSLMSDRPDR